MLKEKEALQCDLLVVGGGIAGLMGAIAGAEKGLRVIVSEKADTRRSGSGATGNDHFLCYLPEVHGPDLEPILREMDESQIGGCNDRSLVRRFALRSEEVVREWDSYGIDMRPTGKFEFNGHAKPGRPRIWLKYAGHNQKEMLTRRARELGVDIRNHMPMAELITGTDGRIVGALCIDVSDKSVPAIQPVCCRAALLATGNTSRLYSSKTAGWMFNVANCPSCTGAGRAAAYRAGASLINLDLPHTHAGMKFFNRCGKATWIGVYRDLDGKPVGPFVNRPTRELGDITGDVWMEMFRMKYLQGEPVFMDCTQTSDEDLEYMRWGLSNEGNMVTLEEMKKQGIDLKRHMVEFYQFEPILVGRGVEIDIDGAAGVPGLYAAGEETGNFRGDIGGSAVYGRIAAESAAEYVRTAREPDLTEGEAYIREKIAFYNQLFDRPSGTENPGWKEVNLTLQQIMTDYAGLEVRSEKLFRAGLTYLAHLKKQAYASISCSNTHEFMRCLETLDLMLVGELLMHCARERKETRGKHIRVDYPFTNPLCNNRFVKVTCVDGAPLVAWRDRH